MGKCCPQRIPKQKFYWPESFTTMVIEGGVRVCADAVFAEFFILSWGIAVLQNQAVCDIWKFSGNFNATCGFLTLFYALFTRNSVRFCSIRTPPCAPLVMALVFSSNKSVTNKEETIHHFHIDHNTPCLSPKTLHNHCLGFLLGWL